MSQLRSDKNGNSLIDKGYLGAKPSKITHYLGIVVFMAIKARFEGFL
jgi:hypothetical protein